MGGSERTVNLCRTTFDQLSMTVTTTGLTMSIAFWSSPGLALSPLWERAMAKADTDYDWVRADARLKRLRAGGLGVIAG